MIFQPVVKDRRFSDLKITHSGRFTTVIGQNIKSRTEHSIVMGEDTTNDGGNYDISIGGNQNISNSHHTVALVIIIHREVLIL